MNTPLRTTTLSRCLFVAIPILLAAPTVAQETAMVSLLPDGSPFTATQASIALSGDGAFAVLGAQADAFSGFTLYRRDLLLDSTEVVIPISAPGIIAGNPDVNQDGSRICFESSDAGLFGLSWTWPSQIGLVEAPFPRTLATLITINTTGGPSSNGGRWATISNAGTRIAFQSIGSDLMAGFSAAFQNVWVRDTNLGTTTLVTESTPGFGGNANSIDPRISGDGRWVVFRSSATDLAGTDTNGFDDIYVHDLNTGTTTLVSRTDAGAQANGICYAPQISDDGRFIAYGSQATNLDGSTIPGYYLLDRDTGGLGPASYDAPGNFHTRRILNDNSGNPVQVLSPLSWPYLSGDGKHALYNEPDSLRSLNPTHRSQLYLEDLETGQVRNLHVDSNMTLGDGASVGGWNHNGLGISHDGAVLLFRSDSTNLDVTLPDPNFLSDTFVHLACPNPAINLGFSLAGSGGVHPSLQFCGEIGGPAPLRVMVRQALPGANAFLIFAGTRADAPVVGGTLVPSLLGGIVLVPIDASGSLDLFAPSGIPTPLFLQVAVVDSGAVFGWALTNALEVL